MMEIREQLRVRRDPIRSTCEHIEEHRTIDPFEFHLGTFDAVHLRGWKAECADVPHDRSFRRGVLARPIAAKHTRGAEFEDVRVASSTNQTPGKIAVHRPTSDAPTWRVATLMIPRSLEVSEAVVLARPSFQLERITKLKTLPWRYRRGTH